MLPWPQHLIITMSLMATVSYLHWLWLLFYFTTLVKSPGAIKHLLTQSLYAHFTWLHCFHKVYSFSKLSRRVKYIKLTVKRFGWQQTKLPWLHTVTSSVLSNSGTVCSLISVNKFNFQSVEVFFGCFECFNIWLAFQLLTFPARRYVWKGWVEERKPENGQQWFHFRHS